MCQALIPIKCSKVSSKLWFEFWLFSGASSDISNRHWYLPNAQQLSTHDSLPPCWSSHEPLTRMFASWEQGPHPNTLFLVCGASVKTQFTKSQQITTESGESFRRWISAPCGYRMCLWANGVCCAVCACKYLLCLFSLCQLVSVGFRVRGSDFRFTSHYLLLIMLCTKICWNPQN